MVLASAVESSVAFRRSRPVGRPLDLTVWATQACDHQGYWVSCHPVPDPLLQGTATPLDPERCPTPLGERTRRVRAPRTLRQLVHFRAFRASERPLSDRATLQQQDRGLPCSTSLFPTPRL